MRLFLIFLATALVAGCSPTVDTAIRDNLPKVCAALTTAYTALSAAGETNSKVEAAWKGAEVVCSDPSAVDSSTALVVAATAYATVARALRESDK